MMNKKILITIGIIGILALCIILAVGLMKLWEKPEFGTCKTDEDCRNVRCVGAYCEDGSCKCPSEKTGDLSHVKVASVYGRLTDGKIINRSLDDVTNILKETKTDFVFRGFWRFRPCPDKCSQFPPNLVQQCEEYGYSYEHLKDAIQEIKKDNPDIIISGAIGAQYIWKTDWDPDTNQEIVYPQTWDMALDPSDWEGISISKELFQCRFAKSLWWIADEDFDCSKYNPEKQEKYLPDITNHEYQRFLVGLAKKQIDLGADAIWVDLLYKQAIIMMQVTRDPNHPAVKDAFEASSKIVDDIHGYGESRGRKIYVGTWSSCVIFPYTQPDLDFVTVTPSYREVSSMELDNAKWNNRIKDIRDNLGVIPIFAFIDYAMMDKTPMGAFSQELSPEDQRKFLEIADEFFQGRGVNFVYPVHGGYMGKNARILSFGRSGYYDSLAPEFQTYEAIKELALKKAGVKCGNNICESGEDGNNCPEDCCVSGDGICRKGCIPENDNDCETVEPSTPFGWIYEGPIYETHPYYYNGTFKGLSENIPGIADLGVKTIYLMPIFGQLPREKGFGYIYHTYDYYTINSVYGTSKELKELIDTAHKYSMKVLFDLVTCCTWEGSYIWNQDGVHSISLSKLQERADVLGWTLEYEIIRGDTWIFYSCNADKSRCELAGMVVDDVVMLRHQRVHWGFAIDKTDPAVIDYFTEAAKYYAEEYDIDGWRLDAPSNNWNPNIIDGDHSIQQLLRSAKEAMVEIKPGAIFLGEGAYISDSPLDPVLDEMCEVSYGRFFNDYIFQQVLRGLGNSEELVMFLKDENIWYDRTRTRYVETHDTPRINKKAPQLNKPSLVLLSTIPGVPMIQAGQEIGATNPWFTESPISNPQVDWTNEDYELRDFYKKVFEIRNNNNAIKYGSIENVWKSGDNTYAYLREYGNERVIVVVNFLDREASSYLDLSFLDKGTVLYDELNDEKFTVTNPENFRIFVPVYGSRMLTLK